MTVTSAIGQASVFALLTLCLPGTAVSQLMPQGPIGGPSIGPVVAKAPFSAEATTLLTETRADGTTREHRLLARYFRDSEGRVRVNQLITDEDAIPPAASRAFAVIQPDPTSYVVYVLDPAAGTYQRIGRGMFASHFGGASFHVPVSPVHYRTLQLHDWRNPEFGLPERPMTVAEEALGTKPLEGVTVKGRRFTATVPASPHLKDGAVDIVDERWESPELRLLMASTTDDPRSGHLEYRVTTVRRTDPSAHLFVVPSDYTERTQTNAEPFALRYDAVWFKGADRRPGGR